MYTRTRTCALTYTHEKVVTDSVKFKMYTGNFLTRANFNNS